jgi:hypothetical protein
MKIGTILAGATMLMAAAPSLADINLELRPVASTVEERKLVHIGIYAVSDSAANQQFSTLSIIFSWDPAVMCLQALDAAGGPSGSFSFPFPDNSGNNEVRPPQDGGGMIVGFATPLGTSFTATPAGTLLRTLVFEAEEPTAAPTSVQIQPSGGSVFTLQTQVLAGAGTDVTGTLGSASITITDVSNAVESCRLNDTNQDGAVNIFDLLHILGNWGAACQCCTADVNDDNQVNVFDILALLSFWGCTP